jgi:hypothetical protein
MDTTGLTINGSLVSEGTPTALNRVTPIMAAQESSTCLEYQFLLIGGSGSWQNLYFRFTDLPNPGGGQAAQLWEQDPSGSFAAGPITLRDSQMRAGRIFANLGNYYSTSSQTINLSNNWFERPVIYFWRCPVKVSGDYVPANLVVNAYNNLFHWGFMTNIFNMASFEKGPPTNQCPLPWAMYDNLFLFQTNQFGETGSDSLGGNVWPTLIANGYNGYFLRTNWRASLGSDITNLTVNDFQTGTLGNYYYPTSGTNLARLLNVGSTSAANLGLYHYTVTTNNVIEGSNTVSIGYHYIATDTYGNLLNATGDGVADYIKDANGDGVFDSGDLADWQNPFNIYDQGTFAGSFFPNRLRLGYWKFNSANLTNQAGQTPSATNGLSLSNSWDGSAVSLNSTSSRLIYNVSTNGQTLFNPCNGTIRFWFQPNWSNGSPNAPDYQYSQMLFYAYANGPSHANVWYLDFQVDGPVYLMQFVTQSNQYVQQWSFPTGGMNGAPITFQSNLWYQFVLSYSPTNVALYTNGALLASACASPILQTTIPFTNGPDFSNGPGVCYYPPPAGLTNGFSLGNNPNDPSGNSVPLGQMDELETFNYPLTPEAVAAGFPSFAGNLGNVNDTNYLGVSDMLQTNVYGFTNLAATNMIPVRLGYWRFDSPLLYAEQGQIPLSQSGVTFSNDWSGTAVNIGSASTSHLTYRDVYTNGWASINCRQGSVRFWFKPGWSSGSGPSGAPFLFLGNTSTPTKWSLEADSSGNAISFITQTNGHSAVTYFSASCQLTPTNWTQIVLDYGPNGAYLYLNGVLAGSNTTAVVTNWPGPADRALGLVIGNNTSYNSPINGQFDELETFNYQLSAGSILSNFQTVTAVDSDLDGVPDVLEDIQLLTNRPYLGAPVTVAGTIKAEQFDMGGTNIAYHTNVANNVPNAYRNTGMVITNCDDNLGTGTNFGYCLDQTHAGDWAKYTINVLAPGNYTVEARVAGIGTNGTFQFVITNLGGLGVTSSVMTNLTTAWTNVSCVVPITNAGTNVLTLCCLVNGTNGGVSTGGVGRFNYFSVYPWWQAGVNTNGLTNFPVSSSNLDLGSDYWSASNNAFWIQAAINELDPVIGGIVTIPAGTYYVAQYLLGPPNEASDALHQSAAIIGGNNVEIAGAGMNNTILVGHNRATTIFAVGEPSVVACTNFTLRDMTLQAQPHLVAIATNGYTNYYEEGWLKNNQTLGYLCVLEGNNSRYNPHNPTDILNNNITISNCLFLHSTTTLNVYQVSNCVIQNCNFVIWDNVNTNANATNNNPPTQLTSLAYPGGTSVGIFGTYSYNINIVSNVYNGNTMLTNSSNSNTNNFTRIAPDGLVWLQSGGNCFVTRNTINNYQLEGIQFNAGPNAAAGNTFNTLVSDYSACAVKAFGCTQIGLTDTSADYSTTFIGNWVYGGRHGELGSSGSPQTQFAINFSGNYVSLFPPFNENGDGLGAAVTLDVCQTANVCGNTLAAGGYGLLYQQNCTNALVLMNNFAGASYGGIGYQDGGDFLLNAAVLRNFLAEGVSFHVQLPYPNNFGWFLNGNTYSNGTTNVPAFLDPMASSVHTSN